MNKIIFITDQFQTGGVETVFLNIANNLKREIVLFPAHTETKGYLINQLPENVLLIENEFNIKRTCLGIFQILKTVKVYRKKFQIHGKNCTVINFSDTLTSLLLAKILSPNYCITWIHCCPSKLLDSKCHKLYFYLIKKCKYIIFICRSQRELFFKLDESKNIDINKTYICTNFLNLNKIESSCQELLKINFHFFLMAARLDMRSKDFKTLVKGYSMLPQTIREKYKLIILGEGRDKNKIKDYINQQGQENNILLLGNQENPYKYMRASCLFIHASKSEGFSMVLIEALACGCTIVASDCEVGPSEILENGKYGYLYKQGDAVQLADKIQIALEHPIAANMARYHAEEITKLGMRQMKEFFSNVK